VSLHQIWTDKSAKLKEMVCDVRDCVLHLTNNIYPDASANCRYCIRGLGGNSNSKGGRGMQMSAEGC
jgi:hypothetical protein